MPGVERIEWRGELLALVLRAGHEVDETTLLTAPELPWQAGLMAYPADGEVMRHEHRAIERCMTGTAELIVVRRGHCEIDIYSPERELITSRELVVGDTVFLFAGGHGLRMTEETVLLMVKQGPYPGPDEKERF